MVKVATPPSTVNVRHGSPATRSTIAIHSQMLVATMSPSRAPSCSELCVRSGVGIGVLSRCRLLSKRRARAVGSLEAGGVVQLGRAAIGLPHDLFNRRGEELVAKHHGSSVYKHIAHVAGARRVHHQRYGIADRRVEMRLAQVENDQ